MQRWSTTTKFDHETVKVMTEKNATRRETYQSPNFWELIIRKDVSTLQQ